MGNKDDEGCLTYESGVTPPLPPSSPPLPPSSPPYYYGESSTSRCLPLCVSSAAPPPPLSPRPPSQAFSFSPVQATATGDNVVGSLCFWRIWLGFGVGVSVVGVFMCVCLGVCVSGCMCVHMCVSVYMYLRTYVWEYVLFLLTLTVHHSISPLISTPPISLLLTLIPHPSSLLPRLSRLLPRWYIPPHSDHHVGIRTQGLSRRLCVSCLRHAR